jgi:hypothetical protein
LALAAFSLRLAVVGALSTAHAAPVTYEHGEIARNLLAGRGFSVWFLGSEGPTSQQAPLYPALLASLYWAFGADSPTAVLMLQILQCAAGAALVVRVVRLTWSLVPDRPLMGWLAGIGAAVYPTHLYMVTHVQVAPWAALVLTALAAVAADARSRGWRQVIWAGILAGTLLLLDPILALALPVLVCTLCWSSRDAHARPIGNTRRLAYAGLFALVAASVVSPWLIRNYRVHGEFVFVKSTFGYAFWQGNNPLSWGTDKIPKPSAEALRRAHDGTLADMDRALWEARHETLYIDDVLLKPTGYQGMAGLCEPARSRLLFARAWKYVTEHPAHYARLCLRRLRYFLLFDETNPKAANPVYRVATVTWLVLAAVGALLLRPAWRQVWPTWAIFGLVTLFHSLTIVSARFRLPIEPLSFVWAAATVEALARRSGLTLRQGYRRLPTAAPALKARLQGPHFHPGRHVVASGEGRATRDEWRHEA